ncbi:MAG: hypothetical protein AAF363_10010 [Bacteroidota bacterium]
MKRLICAFALLILISSCGSNRKSAEQALLDQVDSTSLTDTGISEEVISDIIQQIPSPLEISVLLKEVGTEYDNDILNAASNTSKYNSNYKRALNLGIYGTDLGYTNIYSQNQDALFYLKSIRDLADGLSIGQFFDFGTISRLATNSNNLDSLLLITTQNFNKINSYLQEQKRSNLSVLLLAGGWLEALHISCQVNEMNGGNAELVEKIGEQKIILENIMLLLSFYSETDPSISKLMENFTELKDVYDQVEITYTYEDPTYEVVDGVLTIVDNSSSSINITDQNINDITRITASIREKVIN